MVRHAGIYTNLHVINVKYFDKFYNVGKNAKTKP